MIAPADFARAEWPCPLARTWGDAKVNQNCRAEGCPVWRWVALSADDPDFKAAIAEKMKEFGGGAMSHRKAVEFVSQNREALGLQTKPTHGFCGMGGKP